MQHFCREYGYRAKKRVLARLLNAAPHEANACRTHGRAVGDRAITDDAKTARSHQDVAESRRERDRCSRRGGSEQRAKRRGD